MRETGGFRTMREMKFRAWDKESRKMFSENIVDDGHLELYNGMSFKRFGDCLEDDCIELMQFTDFKDKNGKEICEGDIVQANFRKGKKKYIVSENSVYGNSAFMIPEEFHYKLMDLNYEEKELEVIGNKFENPELLK